MRLHRMLNSTAALVVRDQVRDLISHHKKKKKKKKKVKKNSFLVI